jgi:tetratricopeptide (TPR) repeat protein
LVQRDVLHVLADPLSPERGDYRFSQELLRQVAYETLSKKDRKKRHLAAATHLRSAFANDGEEIADAIARHYLDAVAAGPADEDAEALKGDALAFLIRAAQRAKRSGAPSQAADTYAKAAAVAPSEQAAVLLEHAGRASDDAGDYPAAIGYADAAAAGHRARGDRRGVARAQSLKGDTLRRLGRHAAARTALNEALEILREEPDTDTVNALGNLASLEAFSANFEECRRLITEALALSQALGMGDADLAHLFVTRGIVGGVADRLVEAACDLREGARLAESAGDYGMLGRAELNLADVLFRRDPRLAADAAQSAATHIRRAGQKDMLGFAIGNQSIALIELGEWDQAASLLHHALDSEGEGLDSELLRCLAGTLAALRGDRVGATSFQESVLRYRQSEDPQDQSVAGILDAFTALCAGDLTGALRHAMLVWHKALGIGSESQRWAWPLAARAARSLGDTATLDTLLASLDAHPVGHVPPVLRAQRVLVGALLSADRQEVGAVPALAEAIGDLRRVRNPYQLAHALLDYAEVLLRSHGVNDGLDQVDEAAGAAMAEATQIAERLGCQPLLERAAAVRAGSERAAQAR